MHYEEIILDQNSLQGSLTTSVGLLLGIMKIMGMNNINMMIVIMVRNFEDNCENQIHHHYADEQYK